MKVLVVGGSGLVGSRFVELASKAYYLLTPSHQELNITYLNSVKTYFSANSVDKVVNFAAYTNVGEAENQRGDKRGNCWKVNVEGVKNLLTVMGNRFFIQISTDMVFSGSGPDPGPYAENHEPSTNNHELTWYGYTKAEAERLVGDRGTIVRLIYPVRAKYAAKLDYLRKPLDLYNQGKLYPLFTDQQISLTFIDEACQALQKVIDQNLSGIFHMSCPDTTTPYEIITYLLQKLGKDISGVRKSLVDSKRYPQFGGLKPSFEFSPWRQIVDKLIEQGISTS